jgi:hypothetical protein
MGDRGAGKTTYLAALLRYPCNDPTTSLVQRIITQGNAAANLKLQAQNILEHGLSFPPTPLINVSELGEYGFKILLKVPPLKNTMDSAITRLFKPNQSNNQPRLIELIIECKDYPGEFFSNIAGIDPTQRDQYMQDCAKSDAILFLIDGMDYSKDIKYERQVTQFFECLDYHTHDGWKGSFALGLTKCENPVIGGTLKDYKSSGKDIKAFIQKRFPRMVSAIQTSKPPDVEVECFALSAFGVIGGDKQANVKYVADNANPNQKVAVIKNPTYWKPFGLISPLYWLCAKEKLDIDSALS